jgi:putative transposase
MASTLTNLLYHIVFSTKHRQPLILPDFRDDLYKYMGGINRSEKGVLLEIGGMPDHVHLVTRFRSDPSVAHMVKVFKAKSSKWVNEQHARRTKFAWQTGYAAFTVSKSQLPAVRRYAQRQESHHRRRTFQEEYRVLLQKHEIDFEERYIWD